MRNLKRAVFALAVAAGCASVIVRGADADLSRLQQRVDRLEAMTQRVEALSAIKRLQYAYGHYAELGLWHDFADLFADTGVGNYTTGALNRDQIRALFLNDVGGGQVGLKDGRIYPHISMQPVLTLAPDGQSAKGRWHIMAMLGGYQSTASWAGGVYENQYARENGVWKMQEVRYLPQYSGRYEDPGWTGTKQPAPFHYDVARVGAPILEVPIAGRATTPQMPQTLQTIAALGTRMADLSVRAQRLSDEIEVINLQHAYGYYVDRKMWDDVADLFATNGTMEVGLEGVYVGRASIRRGLNAFGPAGLAEGEINDHIHLQTIVSVLPDGRSARARGTDIGMIGTSGGKALWTQSTYENQFVKQDGVWKFAALRLYPRFIVDAEQGWGKDAQPAPGPSKMFPPDRPPTDTYEIYPRFHIAPVHFDHPVTGRHPQYPEGTKAAPSMSSTNGRTVSPPKRPVTTVATLESLLRATEQSIDRSKTYHAAENLASAYGYYVDEFAWDETADLFSRDGWKELAYAGTYVGRERIRESMKRRYPNPKSPDFLTLHQIVQPVIHVSADGQSAKIRGRLWQMGGATGGAGSWLTGIYELSSVAENGALKLSGMDLDYVWTAPSRGGWVRVKTPPAAPPVTMVKEFPPDRPLRGPVAAPFPKVGVMPFHYRNPVSRRAPPLLLP